MQRARGHDDRVSETRDPAAQMEEPSQRAHALRIAVALDSFQQPAWICHLLDKLQRSAAAAVVSVGVTEAPAEELPPLTRLYLAVDRARHRRDVGDALELCDIRTILPDSVTSNAFAGHDLALDLSGSRGQSHAHPRFGTWTVEIGDGPQSMNGLREFLDSAPATVATIHAATDQGDAIIGRVRLGTDLISYHRGLNRLCWSAGELLAEKIDACARGSDIFERSEAIEHEPRKRPRTMLGGAASACLREVRQKVRDRWMRQQWFVAFGPRIDPERPAGIENFRRIVPPDDRIWADPFAVERDGRRFIFVEQMKYHVRRGTIAVIETGRDGSVIEARTVLARPYHLSYPCLFRWKGDDYMLPESGENRTIEIYRCTSFPDRWEPAAVLFEGLNAVDSTIFEAFDRWWLYTSLSASRRTFEELLLFHAPTPFGPWEPHRLNPLTIDTIGGRCAGRPFHHNGRLYRAAQIGTRRYGYAMQLREILTLTPEAWIEREVSRILPHWQDDLAGTHTLNVAGDLCVIDGLRYQWRRRR